MEVSKLIFASISSKESEYQMRVWEEGRDIALERVMVPLSAEAHKGSYGRIAVLGGNSHYTGAPFYAAMAALKTGADLAQIFTADEAAIPIKSYSPELMVVPVYNAKDADRLVRSNQMDSPEAQQLLKDFVNEVTALLEKLHCLVIGPGLGRCPLVFRAIAQIIDAAKEANLFLVFDGDGLAIFTLPEYRGILHGYKRAVLTPNVMEYKRLFDRDDAEADFASVIIVAKGKEDVIYSGNNHILTCAEEGGLKRSGGIGDVLSGILATLVAWHSILLELGTASPDDLPMACWTSCCFIKRATRRAYHSHRRAMAARDILNELGPAIHEMTKGQGADCNRC